jgi:hypothetical protein
MVLHLPHTEGGFGVTFNDVTRRVTDSDFYTTTSRFVSRFGAFSQERQGLWLPKDDLKDPSSWSSSQLLFQESSLQSQDNVGASGGLNSQDGVSQKQETFLLSIPQPNLLFEASFAQDESLSPILLLMLSPHIIGSPTRYSGTDSPSVTSNLFRKRILPSVSSSLRQCILFKKLKIFGYDGVSHCLYFLNSSYSDPVFTSGEDTEDPWVNMKLYISNTFDSLCVRLVLHSQCESHNTDPPF